ncbi:uncharacterized protein LOC111629049 isoform X2 [Centruroides sculpturatus]|uniref:uncharacterized protein LOC111629049 isoform X2 n=1 Tax=Centruroides sculpturatus TaxID=218467 RepID=UPI000C6C94E1|nr:uncharacterized protein LOC111629049 isoform X2 [Centruroides sculpturatus]
MTLVLTANFGKASTVGCIYDEETMDLENAIVSNDNWLQKDNIAGQQCVGNGTKRKQCEELDTEEAKRTKLEENESLPRRRVPLLWSPRMKWKDERRKVLKMSVNKLRRIDDPEAYLRRSVLINNTVRKLQMEIRQERNNQNAIMLKSKNWGFDPQLPDDEYPKNSNRNLDSNKEDVSCDEIFGVHEEFLRINLPDRCPLTPERSKGNRNRSRNPSGSSQCATQYRTVKDFLVNDSHQGNHFDNVVYHSLLASLES